MANLVAGVKVQTDDVVSIILTCKYMGWGWHEYMSQPFSFLQAIDLFRKIETEEISRQSKYGNNH